VTARAEFEKVYRSVCESKGWKFSDKQVDVEIGADRHQAVHLDFFEHDGRELVRFHSTIGSTERIRSDRLSFALEVNYGLPHGSLAVKEGMLVMVDTLILNDADPAEIEATVGYLADTADYYERTMFGPDAY
jgi:hypothetical protein